MKDHLVIYVKYRIYNNFRFVLWICDELTCSLNFNVSIHWNNNNELNLWIHNIQELWINDLWKITINLEKYLIDAIEFIKNQVALDFVIDTEEMKIYIKHETWNKW